MAGDGLSAALSGWTDHPPKPSKQTPPVPTFAALVGYEPVHTHKRTCLGHPSVNTFDTVAPR